MTCIASPHVPGAPSALVPTPAPMVPTPALMVPAAPLRVTISDVAHEITTIQTSRYNKNYYCTIKSTRWTDLSSLSIDFILVGDRSLGDLQDPMASTLSWPGGSAKPKKHTYEVNDLKDEFVEGTLFYEGVPQEKTLDFEFGSTGYSWVKLTPLKVESSPLAVPRL